MWEKKAKLYGWKMSGVKRRIWKSYEKSKYKVDTIVAESGGWKRTVRRL